MEDTSIGGKHYLTPMSEVIKDLREKGIKMELKLKEGKLQDMDEEKSFSPENLRISDEYRFEGTTNPAKMTILYVLESKDSGEKGYISNAYGPYADTEVNDFIKAVEESNHTKARKDVGDR